MNSRKLSAVVVAMMMALSGRAANAADVTAAIGDLPEGKSVVIKFQAQVNSPLAPSVTSVSNQGSVSGTGFGPIQTDDPGTVTANDATVTTIVQPQDLIIGKSHSGPFVQGDSSGDSYTLTVTNQGGNPTSGTVTVTDTLPAGLTPTSATGTGWGPGTNACTVAGQTVTCTRGSVLAATASYPVITIAVSVATNAASVTNTATVSGGGETRTDNDTASDPTTITGAPATHFGVVAPGTATAGAGFSFTVTALNTFGFATTNYSGTVHFTSTDGAAILPANATLTNGVGTFSATLKTAGSQTITATDTVTSSIAGTSGAISVGASAVTHFAVSAPSSASAGSAFSFTVTALDAFNNTATGYAGTVHFTSSDGQAALPANSTLTNGVGTFSATLKTAGSQTITATDTVSGSITGTSNTITVSAGAATHYAVSAPSSATAGSAFSFTVTAQDQFNNTATTYAGSAHFTSTDGQAVLPANSTLTSGVGTFSATLKTTGSQTITATDVVTASITGTSNTIAVSAAAATHFTVSAPSSAVAGTAFSLTVTAQDQFNNTATGYTGIAHFTSTDGAATLPANTTLTSGVGTFSATLKTAGSQTITATDTATSSVTGTSNAISVSPAAATHFAVSAPASATAGTSFSFSVTALDAFNNTATAYAGTVHFTSPDSGAALPSNSTLTNGTGTFSAALATAGSQTITATDTVTGSITGTSNTITVSAAAATHLAVNAPSSATAGTAFNFIVTAQDQFGNTATSYTGTVHFTGTDGAAVLPADSTLTNGTAIFSATLKTAGSQTITATDTVTSTITGTSNAVTVSAAAATHFAVSAPTSSTAGSAFTFTVTALDQFNNTATGYAGTVHFTSSDGAAVLPANTTLTSGVGTFSATLKTAGSQTITATDTVTSSVTGTSNTITVSAAAATHYAVSAPSSATAGTAFTFTVTALDQFNNTATGYTGTVHFTSSDAQAVLPSNSTLTSGVGTFSATLKTAGSQTITATDTVSGSITGTSNTIALGAAAATHFTVSAPSSATAGTAFNFTVTALDAFNNTATGYAGTVHFTSTDGAAVLPANSTLTSGVGTFSATLKTAGSRTITATDTVTSSITGTSSAIIVSAAPATHFAVVAPAVAGRNQSFSFTVTALDQFNNTATAYAGTVHFTSTDAGVGVVLPANSTLTSGAGTFSATLQTLGPQTITATDTVTGSITGTSNTIAVQVVANLAITKTDNRTTAVAGAAVVYTIVVTNAGPDTATGVTVTDTLPSGIASATWTCAALGGGTCAASGTNSINDTVNVPMGATLTYTLVAQVGGAAASPLSNTAMLTLPLGVVDTNLANNTATDIDAVVSRPHVGDFNNDTLTDIALYNRSTREVRFWSMGASFTHTETVIGVGPVGARVVGVGDYDGNGSADLLWHNASTGAVFFWLNSSSTPTNVTLSAPAGARVYGSGDYNGDGLSDILWFNGSTGAVTLWLTNGTTTPTVATPAAFAGWTSAWKPVADGDYDNDGRSDVFWQNSATQQTSIWFMNGAAYTQVASSTFGQAGWKVTATGQYSAGDTSSDVLWSKFGQTTPSIWKMTGATRVENAASAAKTGLFDIVGSGRYDASGSDGVLWRNRTTGQVDAWILGGANGNTVSTSTSIGLPPTTPTANWFVVPSNLTSEISDFNNDGQSDLVWQNDSVGSAVLWYLNGPAQIGSAALANQPAPTWIIGGVGDFNGDGQADIVAYSSNGSVIIAFMNGNTVTSTQVLPIAAGGGWSIRGVADVNGDGQSDIIWQFANGSIAYWLMNGGTTVTVGPTGYIYPSALGGWRLAGAADLNGDGQTDLILQYQDGQVAYWLLNGTTVGPTGFIYNAPIGGWSVRGTADLNADGSPDLVWQYLDGRVAYWLLNGTTVGTTGYIFNSPVSGWTIRGVR